MIGIVMDRAAMPAAMANIKDKDQARRLPFAVRRGGSGGSGLARHEAIVRTARKASALLAIGTWRRNSATAGHSPRSSNARRTASAMSLSTMNTGGTPTVEDGSG